MYSLGPSQPQRHPNPISCYNKVIKQYNTQINIENNITLSLLSTTRVYKRLFPLQHRFWFIFVLLSFLPFINVLILIVNAFLAISHELALIKYRENKQKIVNPLKNMIYEPSLCGRSSSPFLYFEVKASELPVFKFDRYTQEKIIERSRKLQGDKARFMVYNDSFIAGYYFIHEYRSKSLGHVIFTALVLIFMQNCVYYPIFCLSLLSPFDSWRACAAKIQDLKQ